MINPIFLLSIPGIFLAALGLLMHMETKRLDRKG